MAVLRKIFGTSIAIAVALTVSEPSSAFAQAGGAAPAAPAQGGPGCGRRRWWTSWRPRRSRRRAAVHPCSRCEGPESSPFQLGLVYGHAPKQ